eukprot:TRINITY_DN30010_c0_g1_i1.p2 TRINITY_DN30010_c0_g1~~TRINITY_DN30010_c0_g1_i1.p2  ORF type:complete len:197 (+),score=55.21 TRINITY_DN30010_c0_g1_i1:42-632(+)
MIASALYVTLGVAACHTTGTPSAWGDLANTTAAEAGVNTSETWNATSGGGLPWTWDNATYSPWWATPVPSSSWCDRCPSSTRCVSLSGGMACVSHDYYNNHYDRYGSYNYNNHYNTYDSNYGYYSGSRHEANGWKVAFWVLTAVVFAGLGTAATCWCCRRRKAMRGAVVGEAIVTLDSLDEIRSMKMDPEFAPMLC